MTREAPGFSVSDDKGFDGIKDWLSGGKAGLMGPVLQVLLTTSRDP